MRVDRENDEPIIPFFAQTIRFERQITEWQGTEVAAKFKPVLAQIEGVYRAYVVWAFYGDDSKHSPILALAVDHNYKDNILQAVSYVSQTAFPKWPGFFIDVCLLTKTQESAVRTMAVPFLDKPEQKAGIPEG